MVRSLPLIFCLTLGGCTIETSGLAPSGEDAGNRRDGGVRDGGLSDGRPDTVRDACADCECRGDLDCPPLDMGTWSECTRLSSSDVCAQSGTQTRVQTEWRCVSGRCADFPNMFSQPCTVSTDGLACGDSVSGAWGECVTGSGCSSTGNQTRTITQRVCRAGACASEPETESRSCTVDASGRRCEGGITGCWGTCDGSTCRPASGCSRDSDCDSVCPPACRADCVSGIGSCCWCYC